MDKKKSLLNVSISIASHLLLLIAAFLIRRLLIQYIGNDVNGLNSLYTSIIGMLALAELGVGSAISYFMYGPIVEGDKKKTAALYRLYQRLYQIIGGVIFGAGLMVMPFLPHLISDYDSLNVNVYLNFGLVLVSVALTYLYGAKTSLINAYKDNYITTGILTVCRLIQYGLQAIVLITFRSFPLYLGCHIVETLLIWAGTEIIVRKRHGDIISCKETVEHSVRNEIIRNVKAMFMHKLGSVLVNSIDNVIISAFIGVTILGKYSNYVLILRVGSGVISLFFSPLTSVVGHLCVGGNKAEIKKSYDKFYSLNYALGVVFFLGYFAVVDDAITLCFGPGLEMSRTISFVVSLNGFINFMRMATLLFRNASGAFYYDRWKPVAEVAMNLILSLIFVNLFPDEYKVIGVIVATIFVVLLISNFIEPYVLYRRVFGMPVKHFWIKNYACIALFTAGLFALTVLEQKDAGLTLNGLMSVGVSIVVLGVAFVFDRIAAKVHTEKI